MLARRSETGTVPSAAANSSKTLTRTGWARLLKSSAVTSDRSTCWAGNRSIGTAAFTKIIRGANGQGGPGLPVDASPSAAKSTRMKKCPSGRSPNCLMSTNAAALFRQKPGNGVPVSAPGNTAWGRAPPRPAAGLRGGSSCDSPRFLMRQPCRPASGHHDHAVGGPAGSPGVRRCGRSGLVSILWDGPRPCVRIRQGLPGRPR